MLVGTYAVVIRENRLLTIKFDDETGPHYNFPGGGVENSEDVKSALRREVREETTAAVEVGPLFFVHEYFPPQHDEQYGSIHKLGLFFRCELCARSHPQLPSSPDPNQVGVEWLSLDAIEDAPLLPAIGDRVRARIGKDKPDIFVTD